MNAALILDIRELLSEYSRVEQTVWGALRASDFTASGTLTRVLIAVEKRYAAEIARLYDKNAVSDVAACPRCGCWHFGAYDFGAVCADCDEPLSRAEKAELLDTDDDETAAEIDERRDRSWTADDLASPHSGMPGR